MCGIYGMIDAKKIIKDSVRYDIMTTLAWDNLTRGTDSTGLACISAKKQTIYKKPWDAGKFYDRKARVISSNDIMSPVLLGHNRFATHGKVNKLNSHPFKCDNVIGIHNGVLYDYEKLYSLVGRKPKTQCDSEIIFWLMNHAKNNVSRCFLLEELDGSATCAFWDRRMPKHVYFSVIGNPLFTAIDAKKGILIFSSIETGLKDLKHRLKRHRINLVIRPRQDYTLYDYDMKKGIMTDNDIAINWDDVPYAKELDYRSL